MIYIRTNLKISILFLFRSSGIKGSEQFLCFFLGVPLVLHPFYSTGYDLCGVTDITTSPVFQGMGIMPESPNHLSRFWVSLDFDGFPAKTTLFGLVYWGWGGSGIFHKYLCVLGSKQFLCFRSLLCQLNPIGNHLTNVTAITTPPLF